MDVTVNTDHCILVCKIVKATEPGKVTERPPRVTNVDLILNLEFDVKACLEKRPSRADVTPTAGLPISKAQMKNQFANKPEGL